MTLKTLTALGFNFPSMVKSSSGIDETTWRVIVKGSSESMLSSAKVYEL